VCHSDAVRNGGLSLEHFDAAHVAPSLAAVMLSKITSGLSVETIRAAESNAEAKALVAKGMMGGAMMAAGIPPPAAVTMYGLIAGLTARTRAAHEWSVSAGEARSAGRQALTASVLREVPQPEEGHSAMYRLVISCDALTRAGEIRLSWSPIPTATTLVATVDQDPGVTYRVDGTEKMGNGLPGETPPASLVLYYSNMRGGAPTISLPRQRLRVSGVFNDTVEFPFESLPPDVREATAPCFTGQVSAPVAAQAPELIPAPYLSPQYTAPANAPSSVLVAGRDERGDRLVVTGRTLDGARPVANVSIYVFHTDANGRYAPDVSGPDAELNPRLHAALRTDGRGRYRYETIRPGSYNNNAAHVHYVVIAPGYKPRLLDLWFDDDPVLAARRKAGEPEVPVGIRDSTVCRARPDCVAIRPVTRDARGVQHTDRDIQMVRE
jgi:hypothetical protein